MGANPLAPFVPDSIEKSGPDFCLGLILTVSLVDFMVAGWPLEVAGDENGLTVFRPQKVVDPAFELGKLHRASAADSHAPDLGAVRASRNKAQRKAIRSPARGEIAARSGGQRSRTAARGRNDPDAGDVAILLQ